MPSITLAGKRVSKALATHLHVLCVIVILTLITTFPTIAHIINTDVMWHPAGSSHDVYIKFWDVWYGGQFLAGTSDPLHTNQIFFPRGVSLNSHPFFIPHIIVVNALRAFLPIWNAFSLAYVLSIITTACCAYFYLLWLFKDKWIALMGAVVFGLSPHVVAHPNHPDIAFLATAPLILYSAHRGIKEQRIALIIMAGLLTGLTTVISMYMVVCILITLGCMTCALAWSRWRTRRFWLYVALLALVTVLASLWRVYPLLTGPESIVDVARWHGEVDAGGDALSYIVNLRNPFLDPLVDAILQLNEASRISPTSFLGYVPLLLVGVGLSAKAIRRRMLPWALLCAFFLVLALGSHLVVNGVAFPEVRLLKYYLDQLLPAIFVSFKEVDNFMMGALLPFAILTCFGISALQSRLPRARKPGFILALAALIAFEYHTPIEAVRVFPLGDGSITEAQFAFLEWLDKEDVEEIRLVNLPFGRKNAKLYNLYQSLSGYAHAEGAISRTPDKAFDYIRANPLLSVWYGGSAFVCDASTADAYLAGLIQLEQDGFSHVVFHKGFYNWQAISGSFRYALPAYKDDYVEIYRLKGLRESCPA